MQLVCGSSSSIAYHANTLLVLAKYLFATNGHVPTDWQLKGVAIVGYTVAVLGMLLVEVLFDLSTG